MVKSFSAIVLRIMMISIMYMTMAPLAVNSASIREQSLHTEKYGQLLAQANKKAHFTEQKHQQFLNDEAYASADSLLNATWTLLRKNLSNARFREVQASQRQWIKTGREEEAGALLDSHSEVEAFTIILRNRADELASILYVPPRPGRYEAPDAQFKTVINGHTVSIEGDAAYRQNMCDFSGTGKISRGWITMRHDDFPDFYLLFTQRGAIIRYYGSGESQGCGMNVGFADDYAYSGN